MKTLWTPWRMEHVTGEAEREEGCVFEPPVPGNQSKKHLMLYRSPIALVLLNRFPYANGHLLVAPTRHVRDITELNDQENKALMELIQQCCTILRNHLHPDGINIGLNLGETAGAGIAGHLHFHIVPRWKGDHNFMTVVADVRAIPQHIENTFDMLLPDFKELVSRGEANE